jgi:hypothetical protein
VSASHTTEVVAQVWGIAVCVVAALVFLRAGALKLRAWSSLAGVVDNYGLLPSIMAPVVAAVLPVVEIALAAVLAYGAVHALLWPAPWLPWAELTAAGLLLVFSLAIAINLARGRSHIDCGCGDPHVRQPLRMGLMVRNVGLAAALIVAALVPAGAYGLDEGMIGLVAGVVAYLLYLCQEALGALPQRTRSSPLPPPDARFGFAVHHRSGAAR